MQIFGTLGAHLQLNLVSDYWDDAMTVYLANTTLADLEGYDIWAAG